MLYSLVILTSDVYSVYISSLFILVILSLNRGQKLHYIKRKKKKKTRAFLLLLNKKKHLLLLCYYIKMKNFQAQMIVLLLHSLNAKHVLLTAKK